MHKTKLIQYISHWKPGFPLIFINYFFDRFGTSMNWIEITPIPRTNFQLLIYCNCPKLLQIGYEIYIFVSDLVWRMRLMLNHLIRHTKSEADLFFYTRNLWNERLTPVFEHKITFWTCVVVLWNHKGYCVIKKLVWNFRIKAF